MYIDCVLFLICFVLQGPPSGPGPFRGPPPRDGPPPHHGEPGPPMRGPPPPGRNPPRDTGDPQDQERVHKLPIVLEILRLKMAFYHQCNYS